MPNVAAVLLAASLLAPVAGPLVVTAEAPMGARVLDVAIAGRGRVVVLMDGALALLRRDRRAGLVLLDERPLAVTSVVRAPAGILLAEGAGDTCWAATNQADPAVLFSLEGDRLWEVQRAAALPWPGAPRGAAFRPGTNLIEVEIPALGAGPFVRVGRSLPGWAIGNDGRLGFAGAGWTGLRVGASAAAVGNRVLVASGPGAPGAADRLLFVDASGDAAVIVGEGLEVAGAVTAIAAAAGEDGPFVVAGVLRDGNAHLLLLEPADAAR